MGLFAGNRFLFLVLFFASDVFTNKTHAKLFLNICIHMILERFIIKAKLLFRMAKPMGRLLLNKKSGQSAAFFVIKISALFSASGAIEDCLGSVSDCCPGSALLRSSRRFAARILVLERVD